jgi:hypothetical protein
MLAAALLSNLKPAGGDAETLPGETTAPAPSAPCCTIPAGTPVEIELTQLVSSKTAKPGDHFTLKLASDFLFNGVIVMTADASGLGEVVDAAPAGLAGRPGKLILAARSVALGEARLPLHSFKLAASGRDDSKTAIALTLVPYAGILAIGIHGGNIDYPAGTHALAKVASDTFIAAAPTPAPTPASAAAPTSTPSPADSAKVRPQ